MNLNQIFPRREEFYILLRLNPGVGARTGHLGGDGPDECWVIPPHGGGDECHLLLDVLLDSWLAGWNWKKLYILVLLSV